MSDIDTARQNLAQAIARLRKAEKAMAESLAWVDTTFGLIRGRSTMPTATRRRRLPLVAALALAVLAMLAGTSSALAHEAPTPAGLAIALSAEDCALLGLGSASPTTCQIDESGVRYELVAVSAPDDEAPHVGVELLIAAGYTGEPYDAMSAVYAPLNLVLFDEAGTWTVTLDGLARCEHGVDRPCTGTEWVA